jgi:hypothetical protein
MALNFKKAVREKLWVKILLSGVSGSGKTFSALRIATGIYEKVGGAGIAYVDTENRRASYYADEFSFDVIDMSEPYSPEKYIEAIDAAVDAGYKVIVIDSLSLEWTYLNEVHDKMPGNSFTNWGPLKARHRKLMEKILQSHIHVIATARGKDAYTMEDKNGKQVPKKVAEGIIGDKELEYNYTCTFQLVQDTHIATVMKDNTHLFEGRYEVLTEKDGNAIYDWANSGVVRPAETPAPMFAEEELSSKKTTIKTLIASLTESGVAKTDIAEVIKSKFSVNGKPSANYLVIEDPYILDEVETELKKLAN